MSVGKSITRVDAVDKVTGRAMYTDDFCTGSVLGPMYQIASMEADNPDIYLPSILDKYAARPNSLEGITLATFSSNYSSGGQSDETEVDVEVDSFQMQIVNYY